jgi:acetylglutamate kinase
VTVSAEVLDKARVLAEALPYIREFSGRTVVVKYGGHAMDDPALADLFAQDVVLMRLVGMNPVVVHGGGPQISDLMHRLGKQPEFVDGLRVTDAETVDIVRMALVGKVNREVVAVLNRHGSYAVGLSGEDAGLITVTMRDERLGYVGDVSRVDAAILVRLFREELIAVALGAEKLVYLTDVAGLYENFGDEDSLVSRTDVAGLERLVRGGCLSEGMIPKVQSCVAALRGGVRGAHILDGRIPHALLLEFFTREGIGTMMSETLEDPVATSGDIVEAPRDSTFDAPGQRSMGER